MNTRRIFTVIAILALLGIAIIMIKQRTGYASISTEKAADLIKSDPAPLLLDVRTPEEFYSETGHLAGARLVPLQELEDHLGELEGMKQQTMIAYCRTGRRSATASAVLTRHGFTVLNMEGGIVRWLQEGRPVAKGMEK